MYCASPPSIRRKSSAHLFLGLSCRVVLHNLQQTPGTFLPHGRDITLLCISGMTEEYRLLPPVSLPPPPAAPVLERGENLVRARRVLSRPFAGAAAGPSRDKRRGTPTMQPPDTQHIAPSYTVQSALSPCNDPLRNMRDDIVVFKEIAEGLRCEFRISKRTCLLSRDHGISLSERGCGLCPACSQTILMGLFDRHMESCSRRDVVDPNVLSCARAVAESCKRDQCVLNDTSPPPFPFHTRMFVTDFVFNLTLSMLTY
jgi:hypothetical protein